MEKVKPRLIKIDKRMNSEWIKLTRNQIIFMLCAFANDEDITKQMRTIYYRRSKARLISDKTKVYHYLKEYVKDMWDWDKDDNIAYNKLKISTLRIVLDLQLSKYELLTLLYLIDLYRKDFIRTHKLNTLKVLKEVYGAKVDFHAYKKIWSNALQKLQTIDYGDDSTTFINAFVIGLHTTTIYLDKSHKTKD